MISQFARKGLPRPLNPAKGRRKLHIVKRKHAFLIRLNDEEYERLNALVAKSKLSREDFVRRTLANKKVVELPPVEYGKLIFEMRRVGQNLYRLLTIATVNHFFEAADIQNCLQEIKSLERTIHRSFFAPQKEE